MEAPIYGLLVSQGVIWCPLKPKRSIEYCLVKVLLILCVSETHCDVYILCQESHYVGAFHSPPEPRLMVEKSRARNPAAPTLKGKLTEEKAVILISKTTLIDETLKFPRMRRTICQGMVSQSFNDT